MNVDCRYIYVTTPSSTIPIVNQNDLYVNIKYMHVYMCIYE